VELFIRYYPPRQVIDINLTTTSHLCCSRLSGPSSSERPNPGCPNGPNLSASLPAINLPTINAQAPYAPDANTPDVVVTSSADDGNGAAAQFLTVPRTQFLTVDNMKHAVSIETLALAEDDDDLQRQAY